MPHPSYDPRLLGARCDECAWGPVHRGDAWKPVPSVMPANPEAILIGEVAGGEEVKHGVPFIGPAGQMLDKALISGGAQRGRQAITNAILCDAQGEKLSIALIKLARENKAREKQGLPAKGDPLSCCKPRLLQEIGDIENVLPLGKTAMHALTGRAVSIMRVRGAPAEMSLSGVDGQSTPRKVMPSMNPAAVLHQRRWTRDFFQDIGKAFRYFRGRMRWDEPQRMLNPPVPEIRRLLLDNPPAWLAWDVETDGIEPLTCGMRRFGIGAFIDGKGLDWSMSIGVYPIARTRKGKTEESLRRWEEAQGKPEGWPWYLPHEMAEIKEILRQVMTHPRISKVGHNAGYYDRIVVEQWLGVTPAPAVDTILLDRLVTSELPHGLGRVGTTYLDVENWKAGHIATDSDSDDELGDYNNTDVIVTARVAPKLMAGVRERKLDHLIPPHHGIQDMCAKLHRNGLWVDQERRARAELWLDALYHKTERECSQLAELLGWSRGQQEEALRTFLPARQDMENVDPLWQPKDDDSAGTDLGDNPPVDRHNPRSYPQVGRLLYDLCGLTIPHYTETGTPSTDEDALLTLQRDKRLTEPQQAYIAALLGHRRALKARAAVRPMRPWTMTWRSADGKYHRGGCLNDLRIHPNYNAHVPVTARISSSDPNFQNIEKVFRLLCRAMSEEAQIQAYGRSYGPRAYVGADVEQLELVLAVILSGCARYLEVFLAGEDAHAVTATMLFGDRFKRELKHKKKTGKKTEAYTRMRNFAKTFVYLVIYGGSAETAWHGITSVESGGVRPFADTTINQVESYIEVWKRQAPEFPRWWSATVEEYRRQGYLLDPIDGMRRDFLDGENFNEIVNFKVQAGGAAVVRRMTEQLIGAGGPLEAQRCWSRWGPGSGHVTQTHDFNLIEAGAADAGHGEGVNDAGEEDPSAGPTGVCAIVQEAMTYRHPGFPLPFISKAVRADDWYSA